MRPMENNAITSRDFTVLPVGDGPWHPCPDLLTAEEAVVYLRLDINGPKNPLKILEYYRGRGLLKATRVSKHLHYRLEDLQEFLRIMSKRTTGEN